MVNGIVSLISLSDLLFLVYREARHFWVFILYPATLPDSLMNSNQWHLKDFLCIVSFADSDNFTSFLVWIPFLSFSSLIATVRTSKLC